MIIRSWTIIKKSTSTGLHDKRLQSYVKVVNFILASYATDNVFSRAIDQFKSNAQELGVLASDYAKKLYAETLRYKIVYHEKEPSRIRERSRRVLEREIFFNWG